MYFRSIDNENSHLDVCLELFASGSVIQYETVTPFMSTFAWRLQRLSRTVTEQGSVLVTRKKTSTNRSRRMQEDKWFSEVHIY